jgi:hypothetical protein
MASDSPKSSPRRWQFGLRSAMLVVFLLAVVLAVVSLKLRQDARLQRALSSLEQLGVMHGVNGGGLTVECRAAQLSDQSVQELIEQLKVIGQAHDLGLSPGLAIKSLDLNGANISKRSLARLHEAFSAARIEE